jgi:hypothetical protein
LQPFQRVAREFKYFNTDFFKNISHRQLNWPQ